ncbi:MAG: polysaccharide deacetylase family protein [Acidobacteriota bacterium]|nr:polysaccharide deacetylase family protein [Acidobacteriota bacterium]
MNLEILKNSPLIENLGWTLVSSIWQIGLIALVLSLVLHFFKNFSANARYLLAVAAIGLTLCLPLATFVWLVNDSARNQFSNKTYETENADFIKAKTQITDNRALSVENKRQVTNAAKENAFFSLENLQENFKTNLTSILPMLVGLWIFGVGIFTFRLTGGVWQLHKYKTREILAAEAVWQRKFVTLCLRLKITQTVKLLQSNRIKTPIVIGWLKPVVLIPASVFLQLNPQELETILAHELLHIRRHDNFVNVAQSFIEILFFYHPCGWWISAVVRREREFACDEAVLKMLDSPRSVYANALANLEEIRLLTKKALPPVSMAATGGKLMQRIERILQKNTEKQLNSKHSLWSAGLALLLFSVILTSVFSTQTSVPVNAQTKIKDKKMAVGFVSIPPVDRMSEPPKDADATARLMIANLKAHKVPAIGFVQGGMISDGEKLYPVRANIVRLWRDAGLEIGIGGYKHIWFYDTPYQDYVANTEKNERVVKQILAEKNLPLRYFSYPFLNTGRTLEDKTRFEDWLATRGLRSVKYTFDNQEWMYSYAYDVARKDNDVNTMKEIQAEFVDYMTKMTDHYEAYSQEMFGRDIAQTLVLTPSRLVADSFDEVFGMLQTRGYKFVSMDEAQKDAAYQTEEKFVDSQSGISWFERWQMAQGKKLRDEPKVAADVEKIWNEKKK